MKSSENLLQFNSAEVKNYELTVFEAPETLLADHYQTAIDNRFAEVDRDQSLELVRTYFCDKICDKVSQEVKNIQFGIERLLTDSRDFRITNLKIGKARTKENRSECLVTFDNTGEYTILFNNVKARFIFELENKDSKWKIQNIISTGGQNLFEYFFL